MQCGHGCCLLVHYDTADFDKIASFSNDKDRPDEVEVDIIGGCYDDVCEFVLV